jgi:outer membrane lipoprotein SlyB
VAAALPSSAAVAEPPYGARGATPVASYPQQDSGIFVEHGRQTVGACRDCGTVESIREVKQEAAGTGLGAIAGGALGGAFAGHEVEKQVRATQQYQVTVRLDDGSVRTFSETQAPVWHDGDRVRIANNGQIGGI